MYSKTAAGPRNKKFITCVKHRHSNSGPPLFFLIWSLPRLWYGSLSGRISLNHLSIFYNISCYNSILFFEAKSYLGLNVHEKIHVLYSSHVLNLGFTPQALEFRTPLICIVKRQLDLETKVSRTREL
jgi:hypothetical protein